MTIKSDSFVVAEAGDADLIGAARAGDSDAFAELYQRHVGAAKRLARSLMRDPADTDDLVAETFARVLAALRAGGGPDVAFRAYLLTTLRHVCYDRGRKDRRLQLTDDLTPYEPGVPFEDTPVAQLDRSYAARAFAKLPERWRMVLWHTEVEGETPAQIAPLLGLTPNGVAALAYRARERLRQIYLQEHINDTGDPTCHWTAERLGAAVRGGLGGRVRSKVDTHLADCPACRLLHDELTEVNAGLRGVIGPLVLGAAASGYLATMGSGGLAGLWAAGGLWLAELCTLPARLARQFSQRFGRNNAVAGAGVVVAMLVGAAAVAVTLVMQSAPAPDRPGAAPPGATVPAPAPPPPLPPRATPTPGATAPTPAVPSRGPRPAPPRPAVPRPDAPPAPPPPQVATPGVQPTNLVAGGSGVLPITVRQPEHGRDAALHQPERGRGAVLAATPASATGALGLALGLPDGLRLAGADAGDGWRCTTSPTGAVCGRAALPVGGSSIARVPVAVAPGVTGLRPVRVTVSAGARRSEATIRVAVAPAQTGVAYAVTGRVRAAITGNTLLTCQPRPACLAARDNQLVGMAPYRPAPGEPAPPTGMPAGHAASGAQLALPAGAGVRWAGLYWAGASSTPPAAVALRGPTGGWQRVAPQRVDRPDLRDRPFAQAYAEVTGQVRAGGGGAWWLAAPAAALPVGAGRYAGWSLVVVHEDATSGLVDLAVYAGAMALRGSTGVDVAVSGATAEVGVVLWDGDQGLLGDGLLVGDLAVLDNVGRSAVPGALECAGRPDCRWNSLGVDIATRRQPLPRASSAVRVRAGGDPIELGILTIAAPAPG